MNYRLMKRKNPQTRLYAYYAIAVASGESTLNDIASATEEDFQASLIKKASVCFHAGKSLKSASGDVSYKRVYNKQDLPAPVTPKTANVAANATSASASEN